MNEINKDIVRFINKHHVLTLATSVENQPYCANCFYVYDETDNVFIFTTSDQTKHGQDAVRNPRVAASVVLETLVVGKIRGVQITGDMLKPEDEALKKFKKKYLLRFPFAQLLNPEVWILRPDFLKYTDNRLGFGKKLIWEARSTKIE